MNPKRIALLAAVPLALMVWYVSTREDRAERQEPADLSPVDRLAAHDPAERRRAEEEILALGPDAWSQLLGEAERQDRPAARESVSRLRAEIAKRNEDANRKGSRVSRAWAADPPNPIRNVLQSFTRQTGNLDFPLEDSQADRLVTFDRKNVPFWQAVDDVAGQAGMVYDPQPIPSRSPAARSRESPTGQVFRDRIPADESMRVAYTGAFRIAARLTAIDSGKTASGLRVVTKVHPEPRTRSVFVSAEPDALVLTDATGRIFKAADGTPTEARFSPHGSSPFAELSWKFERTDEDPSEPLSIRGRLTAYLDPNGRRSSVGYVFDAKRKTEIERDDWSARFVGDPTNAGGSTEVRLSIDDRRHVPLFGAGREWVFREAVFLHWTEELDGRKRTHGSVSPAKIDVERSGLAFEVRYRFEGVPHDAGDLAFLWLLPADAVSAVPVEFTVADLPLPIRPISAGSAVGR